MRLAIVTPWYGRDLIGGAERLAWCLSHALAHAGAEIDVLTTCSRSFLDDWSSNYHRAEVLRLESGLTLRRFRVDSRDRVAFNRVNVALTTMPRVGLRGDRVPLDEDQSRPFVTENINSRALLGHLRDHGSAYDAVMVVPYLYGTTISAMSIVGDRAFLIPCLHDEAYAYIEPVRAAFDLARGLLFNSRGEEETAAAIYGPAVYAKSRVIGHAVDPIVPPRGLLQVGSFAPHRSRYVLYLGRQDQTKNIDFLIRAFALFRERRLGASLQLVLAGPRSAAHSGDGVIDLGPVTEEAKAALLTHARALVQPSINESFSRAVFESWYARRPVVVHAACRATARAVEESGGGWIGASLEDWARLFATIDESSDDAIDALGERGWAAALDNGTWDVVARRTLEAVASRVAGSAPPIDHIVPLGNRHVAGYAQELAEALRDAGRNTDVIIAGSGTRRATALRVAHVAGAGVAPAAEVYIAHDGDVELPVRRGTVFAADHAIAARLAERGIVARVLPEPVSPAAWAGVRAPHQRWVDGKDVLLSIAPLDAVAARRLLDVFVAYLGLARDARLLVFASDCDDDGRATLLRESAELDLRNEVVVVGDERAERYAAYRAASVACAIGRPLSVAAAIAPLWFDLPVAALHDPVVAETIELCGVVVDAFEPRRIAALLRILATDDRVRKDVAVEGRRVRLRHAPWVIAASLLEQLTALKPAEHVDADASPSDPAAR